MATIIQGINLTELIEAKNPQEQREISAHGFNRCMRKFLRMGIDHLKAHPEIPQKLNMPNAMFDVERCSRLLTELVNALPTFAVERYGGHILKHSELIKNRDEKYFLTKDYAHMIKDDERKQMLTTMVNLVKNNFSDLPKEKKDQCWEIAQISMMCASIYQTATNK